VINLDRRRTLIPVLLAGLIGLALLWLPLSVLVNLNRGLDVSDTGHYYVSLYHFADIRMMSTQFPLVWKLIPHPDNILVNRLLVFVLLMGSSAALFLLATKAVMRETLLPTQKWLLACAGAGGGAIYYYYWLPDPSYNAIGVILMALILAATFGVTQIEDIKSWRFRGAALLAGYGGLALAATRPVTALVLVGLCVLLYLILARHSWPRLWRLAVFAVLGAVLFFVLVQIFIEPLHTTLARIEGGLLKRQIVGIGRMASQSYGYAKDELDTALHMARWALFLATLGGTLAAPGIVERFAFIHQIKTSWLRLAGALIGAAALIRFQVIFWNDTQGLNAATLEHISYYLLNLGLVAVFTSLLSALLATDSAMRWHYARLSGVCLLMVLGTQSFSIFGTGLWITNAALAAVFTVLACVLAAIQLGRNSGILWALAMTSALILPMVATRTTMVTHPYRLETPLAAQTQKTSIRGGRSTLRLDPLTKAFFDRLSAVANEMGPVGQRPILIDLSGRLPMVQYHLQARPAFTPWLLSAYKGSDAFLAHVIAQMSDEELARAWILDAPDYKHRLNPAPIEARGHNLARDYRTVTTAMAPYIKTDIVVLAPRPKGAK